MTNQTESNDPLGDKILVLEDDPVTARLVSHILTKQGFQVETVDSQERLVASLAEFQPQVVVLDNVPNFPCRSSCALVKSKLPAIRTTVVVYSGISDEADMVTLLNEGADRVIPKVFSPSVLAAELTALLRISLVKGETRRRPVSVGDLNLDPRRSMATHLGKEIKLTQSEFKVLYLLAILGDRVVSREEVIAFLHGDGFQTSDRLVDVFILRLRRKLAVWSGQILTIRGVGYQLLGHSSECDQA